ncbi:hypothetical protein EDD86DRAFT_195794 [Gorgonomyces haynaldii]|nr:hypothetical protein EDD86DRAFT_195794 [Gorgonomyces haynaldii]
MHLLQFDNVKFKIMATNAQDDPMLQAHNQMGQYERSDNIKIIEEKTIKYLPLRFQRTKDRSLSLAVEEPMEDARLSDHFQLVRPYQSHISNRIPKDFISLQADLSSSSEIATNSEDRKVMKVLDEKLARFKEVEELYQEIMKSVDGDKLDDEDEDENATICPAANADTNFTGLFEGHIMTRPKKEKEEPKKEEKRGKPMIILRTKHTKGLSPDDFVSNRQQAMKKIQSSKYTFRYNFGGYIPADKNGKGLASEVISMDDFDAYISQCYCDFLPRILFEEKRIREERERELQKVELEHERERQEENRRLEEKQKEIDEIFKHKKDKWNLGVLEYMEHLNEPPEKEAPLLAHQELQQELEVLWSELKMPNDQKLDMAIKYGSHKSQKLKSAIELWKEVVKLITEREQLLVKIEEFEKVSSNPERLFVKYDPNNPEQTNRLLESRKRESLLRPLHTLEAKINSQCSKIKTELHETVTLEGVPYAEKMKSDYIDIVKKCSMIRKSA